MVMGLKLNGRIRLVNKYINVYKLPFGSVSLLIVNLTDLSRWVVPLTLGIYTVQNLENIYSVINIVCNKINVHIFLLLCFLISYRLRKALRK